MASLQEPEGQDLCPGPPQARPLGTVDQLMAWEPTAASELCRAAVSLHPPTVRSPRVGWASGGAGAASGEPRALLPFFLTCWPYALPPLRRPTEQRRAPACWPAVSRVQQSLTDTFLGAALPRPCPAADSLLPHPSSPPINRRLRSPLCADDMAGGYHEDAAVQGMSPAPTSSAPPPYFLRRWRCLDTFVYFSHR